MITFKRKKENFPICKTCKKPMNYYIFGLPDSEHEHSKCAGERIAKETLAKFFKEISSTVKGVITPIKPITSEPPQGGSGISGDSKKIKLICL